MTCNKRNKPYVFALYVFVMLFRGFLIFFFQHTDFVYICYILWDVFLMYLHCIRSLHFLRAVSNSFLDSARLHPLYILGWFPYVTFFRGFLIFFFSTYRSCIHLLNILGWFPSVYRSCIHLLHLMGCFPYVFALYTFVTLFESCIQFFFRFSSSTSVTYTWVVSLCICTVYVRYTFFRDQLICFSTHRICLHLLHVFG